MSWASQGGRQLDLYDFFSVLLPGVAALISVAPFLPTSINPLSPGMVALLIFGGFIVGRGFHVTAVYIENEWETIPSHRERFEDEINDPSILGEETVNIFIIKCKESFNINNIESFLQIESEGYSTGDLYALVRSAIHIDGRGRSRTFQAIYSFYRSMWIVTMVVGLIYYSYAVGIVFSVPGLFTEYTSHLGNSDIGPALIGIAGLGLFYAAHFIFRNSKSDYQKFYIQYLVADFIALHSGEDLES